HRRRLLPVGIAAVIAVGMLGAVGDVPTDPFLPRLLFDFGAIGAVVAIFLGYDLLTTVVALFGGTLIALAAPLMSVAHGHEFRQLFFTTASPMILALGFGVAALLTRREVVYRYEDPAPLVRRIGGRGGARG